jgi:hypothetical protein
MQNGWDGRVDRPFAEVNARAIPGSHKYIATAGPHHGDALGSIVLIDTRIEDDGAMSQLTRVTPDVRFPESEGGTEAYGTAWPLSEDYYLCNYYDGIYLVDAFGNRELVFETGNSFRPLDPIPLRAREMPPIIPTQTYQGERLTPDAPNATIYINNVYNTDEQGRLPDGVEIKYMRIVQIFPKTISHPIINEPRIGYASEVLARMPLGIVPVEDDGSVYCQAPIGKEIYFQLLDENRMAVQSMRSGTYVHPGEQMSCVGCHESKWESPQITLNPKALQRPPSELMPEVTEGAVPFNWHILVKPVLEEHCGSCHNQGGQWPDMSYQSLRDYAFYWPLRNDSYTNGEISASGSRATPGRFGAHESRLYKEGYLNSSHYDVNLTAEKLHRIVLWLDLNSNELGACANAEAQRLGEVVWPELDVDPDNPTGVERRSATIKSQKRPNVSFTKFEVDIMSKNVFITFPTEGAYQISISSISGKTFGAYRTLGSKEISFPSNSFQCGVYIINVCLEKQNCRKKLIMLR